jgi:hypothetical protein
MTDVGSNNVLTRANREFVVSDFGYAGVELPKRRYSRDLQLLQNPRRNERQIEGAPRVTRALRAHRMESGDGSVAARFLPPTWEEVQRVVLANASRDTEVGDLLETAFTTHGFGEWRRKQYLTFRRDVLKFTDPLVLFRAVNVPSLPSIRTEGVGVYWTYDPRYARDYMAGSKSAARPEDMKILVAVVRPEDVDWPLTIALNIWADTEKEIRLKPGAPVKIVAIYDGDGELVSERVREARANPRTRRKNPVIDLSSFVDNQSVDALSRSVWALSPEGVEGHRSSTAREDRDAWARKVLEKKQGIHTFGEIGRGD